MLEPRNLALARPCVRIPARRPERSPTRRADMGGGIRAFAARTPRPGRDRSGGQVAGRADRAAATSYRQSKGQVRTGPAVGKRLVPRFGSSNVGGRPCGLHVPNWVKVIWFLYLRAGRVYNRAPEKPFSETVPLIPLGLPIRSDICGGLRWRASRPTG